MEGRLKWSVQDSTLHSHEMASKGWLRMRPLALSLLMVGAGLHELAPTRKDLAIYGHSRSNQRGDLAGTCWEVPKELEESEGAEISGQRDDVARYAAHYGLEPPESIDDLITLMVAAGILAEADDGTGTTRLRPARPLPAPGDVFPLDAQEAAIQDTLQFDGKQAENAFRIVSLFAPQGERHEEITTSLQRLARTIAGSPHDARQAVLLLLGDGDFTVSTDVTETAPHRVFRLRCNWADFDRRRIGIRGPVLSQGPNT